MRTAIATGFLSLEEEVAAELAGKGVSGLGNAAAVAKVVALSSAKMAWRYVPSLPRSLLASTYAAARYEKDGMRMWVMVKSEVGAWGYAAFGLLAGLLAAWNTVKGCSRSCRPTSRRPCRGGNVYGIRDLRPVDAPWEELEAMDNSGGPPEVGFFDVSDEPIYEGFALARGVAEVDGAVDPRRVERVAVEAAPRAWEVLPLVHMNEITYARAKAAILGGSLELELETGNRGRTGSAMEAVFGVGVAMIDASSSAPQPRIEKIDLASSAKRPLAEG